MNSTRDTIIIRTSIIGIAANVFLSVFKAVIGIMTHSVAITMDAVNNISDAASSLITIVGTRLAGKEPDKNHPFGYGRIEYMSAMVISILVLYAGITAFTESVKAILHPEQPAYSTVSLIIVAVGVAVKFLLGRYVKSVGEKVDSDALVNSGTDATLDSVISLSTLVAATIYLFLHISLEAWLGAVISLVIIKSGLEMLKETISRILGERADAQLARQIRDTILSFPAVSGVYDLVLHDYGPSAYQGSVHVEVPDTCTANDLDQLLRMISVKVYEEHHVILTAIGVYSINTRDEEAIRMRERVASTVLADPYVTQMHGFYLDKEHRSIRFDIVVSFDAPNRQTVYAEAVRKVQEKYPEYTISAAMDTDFIS
ncbi:MAG: cation diffusion facilitator family transporter [Eubacteriales bacterium]|nr:cation diffusion facilitator family transporter [Eubacteriales bacterium]